MPLVPIYMKARKDEWPLRLIMIPSQVGVIDRRCPEIAEDFTIEIDLNKVKIIMILFHYTIRVFEKWV